jgi:hypothetical protein
MGQAMSTATCPSSFCAALNSTRVFGDFFISSFIVSLHLRRMGQAMSHCNPIVNIYRSPQQHTCVVIYFFCRLLCPYALASHGPSNVHCNPFVDIYRSPQLHTSFAVISFFHRLLYPSALASHGPSNAHCNLSV